jgi:flagellar hook-associated protein 3 FlgL
MINATGNRMTMEIKRQSALALAIAKSQISVSTGKRIQQASDDPVAAARVSTIRRAQADDDAWMRNLDLGIALASQADGVIANVSDNMVRAHELVVSAANGTLSPADRQTLALELNSIADHINEAAKTRSSLGQPLFHPNLAPAFRFSESTAFAPVPAQGEIFSIGGVALLQQLRDAATYIAAGDRPAISASMATLQSGVAHIADRAAEVGLRAQRMDQMREHRVARGIDFAAERSTLEDTDLSKAIAELSAQTLTLEAAQSAFARINRRSLIDILS